MKKAWRVTNKISNSGQCEYFFSTKKKALKKVKRIVNQYSVLYSIILKKTVYNASSYVWQTTMHGSSVLLREIYIDKKEE